MIRYKCPHCGQVLESPESLMGVQETCPKCKSILQVPCNGGDVGTLQYRQVPLTTRRIGKGAFVIMAKYLCPITLALVLVLICVVVTMQMEIRRLQERFISIDSDVRSVKSDVISTKSDAFKVVIANKFVLEDENGDTRAVLDMTENYGPSLQLIGKDGTGRAVLDVLGNGPRLHLYDENDKMFSELGMLVSLSGGGPGLKLFDEKGNTRAMLGMLENEPALRLKDEKGNTRAILGLDNKLESILSLSSEKGWSASLYMTESGSFFSFFDEKGTTRASLDVTKDGSELGLSNENGKTRASLDVNKDGSELSLHGEKGNYVMLGANSLESALRLSDEKPHIRTSLSVMGPAGPNLSMRDENGKTRTMLSENSLGLLDDKENSRIFLNVGKMGPILRLSDENGKDRAAIGVTQTVTPDGKTISFPESSLFLFDEEGKVSWSAP